MLCRPVQIGNFGNRKAVRGLLWGDGRLDLPTPEAGVTPYYFQIHHVACVSKAWHIAFATATGPFGRYWALSPSGVIRVGDTAPLSIPQEPPFVV